MEFGVQAKTDNFLKVIKDGNGVELLGPRKLVEYEIQEEVMQVYSVNNVSRAVLKFVFRRRMEYHVASTFLQVKAQELDLFPCIIKKITVKRLIKIQSL